VYVPTEVCNVVAFVYQSFGWIRGKPETGMKSNVGNRTQLQIQRSTSRTQVARQVWNSDATRNSSYTAHAHGRKASIKDELCEGI
jgi:hypothetical protein